MWQCPKCNRKFKNKINSIIVEINPKPSMSIFKVLIWMFRNNYCLSDSACKKYYQMRQKRFHGVCRPTGKAIISSILQAKKSILDYTPEQKLFYSFQKNLMNMAINTVKDLFKSHIVIVCRAT